MITTPLPPLPKGYPANPPKPRTGDVLVFPDGSRRRVLRRVDSGSGKTSIKIDGPNHWVLDAMWFIRFHSATLEPKNGEKS